jgi:hypothetical protein
MSYPINYPTPQNANVQIFYSTPLAGAARRTNSWVKPQGASFVWFTLIGAGGGDDGAGSGGNSGNVTNFMCPAFLIPDTLQVLVGKGVSGGLAGGTTAVIYQQKDGSGYTLLEATGGAVYPSSNTADNARAFGAMGFYQSIAGQSYQATGSASTTTFLSGGVTFDNTANYGYSIATGGDGFFQMQPIIVGVGGSKAGKAGIGCGAGGTAGATGGDGLAVIITW